MVESHCVGAGDKRAAILQATLSLLSEKGFHGFSMKQLSERAGVAAGTIYLYFKDREDLICQLHEDIIHEVALYAFANHNASLSLAQQYRAICHNFWDFNISRPEVMLSKAQFDHLPPDVLLHQRQSARDTFAPLLDLFDQGRASGELKNLPDEVLVGLGLDPFCTLARQHYLGLVTISAQQLAQMIDAAWDAITV